MVLWLLLCLWVCEGAPLCLTLRRHLCDKRGSGSGSLRLRTSCCTNTWVHTILASQNRGLCAWARNAPAPDFTEGQEGRVSGKVGNGTGSLALNCVSCRHQWVHNTLAHGTQASEGLNEQWYWDARAGLCAAQAPVHLRAPAQNLHALPVTGTRWAKM